MMIKSTLVAVALATLLAGSAIANDKPRFEGYDRYRSPTYSDRYDDRRYDNRRYDRHWSHIPPVSYRGNRGYRAGYETGWRDATQSCRLGYRQGRWMRNAHDQDWYFGLQFDD